MASLPRVAVLLLFTAAAAAAYLTFAAPPARANAACDAATATGAITGGVGFGDPVGDLCNKVTAPIAGVAGHALDPLGDVARSVGNGVFEQISSWVGDGAVWLLGRVARLSEKTTSPDLLDKGFLRSYRQMAEIAVPLAALALVFAVLDSLGRGQASSLVQVFLVNLPLAAIATSVAFVVVQLLIATTDGFSSLVAHSTGEDSRRFFATAISALGEAGAKGGASGGSATGAAIGGAGLPLFVGFITAILAAVAAFVVWIELLMRDAAIYASVLFMPIALAASVSPRWSVALKRTAELIVVIVLSKFVIVAIIALAASLLANSQGEAEHVLAAGALLMVASFAPFWLFRLAPFAESAVGSAFHRQSSSGAIVRGTEIGSAHMMRRSALAHWAQGARGGGADGGASGKSGGGGSGARAPKPGGGSGGAKGGTGAAASDPAALPAAVGAAGAKAAKGAAQGTLAQGPPGTDTSPAPPASAGAPGSSSSSGGASPQAPSPAPGAPKAMPTGSAPDVAPSEATGGASGGPGEGPPRPALDRPSQGKRPAEEAR